MPRQTIENDGSSGTLVNVEDGVEYLILYLPDGTIIDISISPENNRNHIKLYDDNDYSIMPMNGDSKIRELDVWNAHAARSTSRGTEPSETTTVEPHEEDES